MQKGGQCFTSSVKLRLLKVECAAASAGLGFVFKLYPLTDGRKNMDLIKGISIKCP